MSLAYRTIAPGTGQAFKATGVFAVHAAVFADQPLQLAGLVLVFGETHQGPAVGAQIAGIIVDSDVLFHFATQVVPLIAGNLTGFAADADGHVNQLGDFHLVVTYSAVQA